MKYVAEDGKEFDNAKACRAYEKTLKKPAKPSEEAQIVDLLMKAEADEFEAALKGNNPELGKILEAAGRICRNARYAKGDFKAKPKSSSAAPVEAPVEAAPPPPPAPLPQAAE